MVVTPGFTPTRRNLSKTRTLRLLADLREAGETGVTLYIPQGQPGPSVDKAVQAALDGQETPPGISEMLANSPTGGALFWGKEHRLLILPPFPVDAKGVAAGYRVKPLVSLLGTSYVVAVVLVRLGAYGIGVFEGERLMSSKVGTGLVHQRHKKGGSSARRFERHREKQAEAFFTRVCGHCGRVIQPHFDRVDYCIYGGERNTVRSFRRSCAFLKGLDNRTVEHLLNIREPGQASLEASIEEAWSSTVLQWTAG